MKNDTMISPLKALLVFAIVIIFSLPCLAATPTINSVVASTIPSIVTPNNSGYFGQSVTINGNNLAAATLTLNGVTIIPFSNSSKQIVFTVNNATGSGGIVVKNNGGTANATFTYLGYVSNQNGDWNAAGTWIGGNVPPANASVTLKNPVSVTSNPLAIPDNILIRPNGSLSLLTSAGNVVFQVNKKLTNNGSMSMANLTTLYFSDGAIFDNGSGIYPTIPPFTCAVNSLVQFLGSGSIMGKVTFNNLTLDGPVTFTNAANNLVTISGNLIMNNGAGILGSAPVYLNTSKLIYNTGGTFYSPGFEWSSSIAGQPGYANNVDIGSTTFTQVDLGQGTVPGMLGGNLHITAFGNLTFSNSTTPFTINGNLIMDAGSALTLSTQPGNDFILKSDWTNKGLFTPNVNTVYFNDVNKDQNFYGEMPTTFYGLTVDKSSHKLLFANTLSGKKTNNLLNSLNVISGTLDLNHNNLILKSSAAITASVTNITGTCINADNLTAERFFPAHRSYRLLSVPLLSTQTINAAWQESQTNTNTTTSNTSHGYGMLISGPQTGNLGFDYTARNNTSMKTYNSALGSWIDIPNTNLMKLSSSSAYMIYLRGSRAAGYDPNQPSDITVLRTNGKLVQGDQVYSIPANQYVLIGNPYPCAIDFSLISMDKNVLGDKFILWDTNLTGNYGVGGFVYYSWNGNSYSSTATSPKSTNLGQYIQSGQAFFVQGGASTTPLTIKENCKVLVNTAANIFSRIGNKPTEFKINLSIKNRDNSYTVEDGTLALYGDKYSNGPDVTDMIKINNIRESVYLQRGKDALAIEARKPIVASDTLFVKVNTYIADYLFTFLPREFNQKELSAFLIDNFTHTNTALSLSDTSLYKFSVTRDSLSYSDKRFMVVFKTNKPLFSFLSLSGATFNKKVDVQWSVENQSEIKNYEIERSNDGLHFKTIGLVASKKNNEKIVSYNFSDENIHDGVLYYRIKGNVLNGDSVSSKIVSVIVKGADDEISVYPNPITNGNINIRFNHFMKGNYQISLVNGYGVVIFKKTEVKSESGGGVISFSQSLIHGRYLLKVVKPDGSVWSENVIY